MSTIFNGFEETGPDIEAPPLMQHGIREQKPLQNSNRSIYQTLINSAVAQRIRKRSKLIAYNALTYATYGTMGGAFLGLSPATFAQGEHQKLFCDFLQRFSSLYNCSFLNCSHQYLTLNCSFGGSHFSTDHEYYPTNLIMSASDYARDQSYHASWFAHTITIAAGTGIGALIGAGIGFFMKIPDEQRVVTQPHGPPPQRVRRLI